MNFLFLRTITRQRQIVRHLLAISSNTWPWRTVTTAVAGQTARLLVSPLLTGSLGLAVVSCSNSGQQEKFFRAVQRGNVGEVERLLKNRSVDIQGRHELGWTALHLAAVNGRQEVHHDDGVGRVVVHVVVQVVSVLLAAGADPDVEDEFMNVYTTAREKQKHSLEVQVNFFAC